jgi:hypothetical protein
LCLQVKRLYSVFGVKCKATIRLSLSGPCRTTFFAERVRNLLLVSLLSSQRVYVLSLVARTISDALQWVVIGHARDPRCGPHTETTGTSQTHICAKSTTLCYHILLRKIVAPRVRDESLVTNAAMRAKRSKNKLEGPTMTLRDSRMRDEDNVIIDVHYSWGANSHKSSNTRRRKSLSSRLLCHSRSSISRKIQLP